MVLLLSVQTQSPSHIRLLGLAFYSTVTPTLSAYTIDSTECNGQAYTAFEFHTGADPGSHKSNYQNYWLQLAQSEATPIVQRDTQVDYAPLIF